MSRAVSALVEPLVSAREFSGAVAMMRGDQLVYARGFGQASHGPAVAFGPDTPSDGGSLAKTFTAAGVWSLVHEGRLTMDSAVQALVPEYPHAGVTVAQLLAHSNGLAPDYEIFDKHFAPGQPRTTGAMLRIAGQAMPAPAFEAGTRFEYTNLGYDAAALVIERVTGQRYAEFVRDRFFKPHGMAHSFARPAHFADWPVPRTRGYRFRDGRWQDHDAYDDEAFLGASNLVFPATDLARWGDAWAHARVLPAGAERAGQAPPLIGGRRSAINGLSWYCAPEGRRCHYTGSLNGFHAWVYWDRDRQESLALVSNSTLPAWTITPLQRGLVDVLAGRPVAPQSPAATALAQRPSATQDTVVGRYHAPDLGLVHLRWTGQQLQLQPEGGLLQDAHPVSRSVFYLPGLDWFIAFSRDAVGGDDSRPSRLHVRSMYLQADATRLPD
ncbi:MAG: beta-lactamase family protein [Rubrivivax sp.]|nr:beta-lactamase family protein [Rubrivivax sp.]